MLKRWRKNHLLKLEVVSPLGEAFEPAWVPYLKVPSYRGQIEILPGHRDAIILLSQGLLDFGDENNKYIIYKGIMEVTGGEKIILAAEKLTLLSELTLKESKNNLEMVLKKLSTETLDDFNYKKTLEKYYSYRAEVIALSNSLDTH